MYVASKWTCQGLGGNPLKIQKGFSNVEENRQAEHAAAQETLQGCGCGSMTSEAKKHLCITGTVGRGQRCSLEGTVCCHQVLAAQDAVHVLHILES